MIERDHDYLFKLVLVGSSGVGKSNLLLRYADDQFTDSYITTIGVDFRFRTIHVNNRAVKLQIWDTAGQERFRTITSAYYRGADGIMIVYDTSDAASFQDVGNWLEEIHRYTHDDNCQIMLVGNKMDKDEMRQVTTEQGQTRAEELGLLFAETSAKTAENVYPAFEKLAAKLISVKGSQIDAARRNQQELDLMSVKVDETKSKKKGGCC